MLNFLSIFFYAFTLLSCSNSKSAIVPIENRPTNFSINKPVAIGENLKAAIADCLNLLEKASGKKAIIETTNSAQADIILLTERTELISNQTESKILTSPEESFYITDNGKQLIIYGKTETALSHGLYFYLEQLGFRFYLPGKNWTIIPTGLKDFSIKIDTVVIPDIKVREFFGSGGFAVNRAVDPENLRKTEWEQWKIRTRMGGNRKIWGHQGYDFNVANRKELVAHPEYLAEIGGKRIPWVKKAKWCISNKDFVSLFIEDRLKEYDRNVQKFGVESVEAKSIGVEPTDGGGHCTCAECEKMGSISTRVFYLANKVAEVFEQKHPGVWVSVLAYNFHADTPDIPLHKMVDVTIIPAGFHDLAPGPAFIEKWHKKLNRPMGMYDYWSIPLWQLDLPRFNLYDTGKRLKIWQKNGVDAILLESSYSKGSIGLALYLMTNLGWNIDQDEKEILSEFYDKCFGAARPPMERMLKRWSRGFMGLEEIPFAIRDINEAEKLVKTAGEKARVLDYKMYVHYLKLIAEFKNLNRKSEDRIAKADEAIHFLWKIHHSGMVHSTGVQDAITHQHEKNPDLQKKWTRRKNFQDKEFWGNFKSITPTEMNSLFEEDKKQYPTLFDEAVFSDNSFILNSENPVADAQPLDLKLTENQRFIFYSDGKTALKLTASIIERGRKNRASAMIATLDGSEVFYFKDFLDDTISDRQTIDFTPINKGFYLLVISLKGSIGNFSIPQSLPIAFWGYPSRMRGVNQLYYHLPKSTSSLFYRCNKPANFIKPDKTAIENLEIREDTYQLKNLTGIEFLEIDPIHNPAEIEIINSHNLFFLNKTNFFTPEKLN